MTEKVWADDDPSHVPLFGPKLPSGTHPVQGHDRHLPPKPSPPEDPNALHLFDPPQAEPQPRIIPIRSYRRHNPRRKKETEVMESRTPPSTVDALEPVQPTGYHGDPPPDLPRLRKRMVEVLRTFRRKDTVFRDTSGFCNWGGAPIREGFTDEELVPQVHQDALSKNVDAKLPSPSGIRTARKDLERAGLVEKAGTLRPTSLGNQAYVFRLTQAGRDFELPQ